MKKALVLLIGAVLILAGCQDEQAKTSVTANEPAQVEQPELEIATIEAAADKAHAANNALDWNGTYTGILPCGDCEGIETKITLNHDGSYQVSQTYLGTEEGSFESQGQLSWNDAGNIITLESEEGANQYLVGENVLYKLDINGEQAQGDLAEQYKLSKE